MHDDKLSVFPVLKLVLVAGCNATVQDDRNTLELNLTFFSRYWKEEIWSKLFAFSPSLNKLVTFKWNII